MRYISFLAVAALLSGCGVPDFKKFVELGGLRVLTIQVDNPEVAPGATVNVTPVISDLNDCRTVVATVQTCIDPGVSVGHQPVCDHPDAVNSSTTTINTTTLGANNTCTGAVNPISIQVPALPLVGPAYVQYNGIAYLFIYTLTDSTGVSVTAFKRIVVSNKPTKNTNPAINAVTSSGVPLNPANGFTTAILKLGISFAQAGETYNVMQPDGSLLGQTEELVNTWFYSEGSTKYQRTVGTDSNEMNMPDSHPNGRAFILVVVTHDGRGGDDYKIFTFN